VALAIRVEHELRDPLAVAEVTNRAEWSREARDPARRGRLCALAPARSAPQSCVRFRSSMKPAKGGPRLVFGQTGVRGVKV